MVKDIKEILNRISPLFYEHAIILGIRVSQKVTEPKLLFLIALLNQCCEDECREWAIKGDWDEKRQHIEWELASTTDDHQIRFPLSSLGCFKCWPGFGALVISCKVAQVVVAEATN